MALGRTHNIRVISSLLSSTNLAARFADYLALLAEMGRDPAQIYARLNNLTRRFGINADALSEIVFQGEDLRLVQSTAAITRYRTALTSLLKKVLSLIKLTSRGHREEEH